MRFNYRHILNIIKNKLILLDKKIDLQFTDKQKALLITFFISGTVLMLVFNLSLKKHDNIISESYYEIKPEKELSEEDIKQLKALEELNASKAETNSAFNETEKSKQFTQVYKTIAPPEDYIPEETDSKSDYEGSFAKKYEPTKDSQINKEELSSFDKVNDLLKKQQEDTNNNKSSISYSLKNRKKIFIPIPVYLCEENGKIVITITVNNNGSVTDANLNSSSNSSNKCLIEHALEYARRAKFNTDASTPSQLGSITFHFIGKH